MNGAWQYQSVPTPISAPPVLPPFVPSGTVNAGDVLTYDGYKWTNAPPQVASRLDGGSFDPYDGGHF